MSSDERAKQEALRAVKAQEADIAKTEKAIKNFPPSAEKSAAQRKIAEAKRQNAAIKKGLGR